LHRDTTNGNIIESGFAPKQSTYQSNVTYSWTAKFNWFWCLAIREDARQGGTL